VEFTLYTHEPVEDIPRLAMRGFPSESYFMLNISDAAEGALADELEGLGPQAIIKVTVPEEFLYVPDDDIEDALFEEGVGEEWEEVEEGSGEGIPMAELPPEEAEDAREAAYDAAAAPYGEAIESLEQHIDSLYDAGHGDDSPDVQAAEKAIEQNEQAIEALDEQYFSTEPQEAEEVGPGEPAEAAPPEDLPEDWPKTVREAIELTQSATLSERILPQSAIVLGHPDEVFTEDLTPVERVESTWFRFPTDPVPLESFRRPYWKRVLRAFFGLRGRR
jgi:hypothetical protein